MQSAPSGECRVIVSSQKAKSSAEIEGLVYFPNIPDLPREYQKFRIKWLFTDLIINNTAGDISFKIESRSSYDLDQMIGSLEFIILCAKEDAKIEIFKENSQIAEMYLNTPPKIDQFYEFLLHRLIILRKFLDIGKYRKNVSTSVQGILDQEEVFRWINLTLAKTSQEITAQIDTEGHQILKRRNGTVASTIIIQLSNQVFIAFCIWKAVFQIGSTFKASVKNGNISKLTTLKDYDSVKIRSIIDDFRLSHSLKMKGAMMYWEPDV
ncbi:hypothetical protein MPOCJGCO_3483 [Methylobacterium trifolii]|uniref:Uncharacterized protein n=2 Tax=Methylobacterium trifolii TaxID=1003092 RepID=A0ABQ4U268_9HYPH|nr:hypothetical protein MPOCJGCO_3483 [Methylobacterium trifolii]